MHPGANTVTVRIQNNRNDGGFLGTPESMFVEAGDARAARRAPGATASSVRRTPARSTPSRASSPPTSRSPPRAALAGAAGAALPKIAAAAPDVVLRLAVVPGQMQFDTTELTVAPGQTRRDRVHQS